MLVEKSEVQTQTICSFISKMSNYKLNWRYITLLVAQENIIMDTCLEQFPLLEVSCCVLRRSLLICYFSHHIYQIGHENQLPFPRHSLNSININMFQQTESPSYTHSIACFHFSALEQSRAAVKLQQMGEIQFLANDLAGMHIH